jgi:alkylation response protein AidB-like acyl-CoA dehydrogenase
MNTFLSDADAALKLEYQQFAGELLAPIARTLESNQAPLKGVRQKIAQAGYAGLIVPKQYGGRDGTFLQAALLCEALGSYEAGVATILATHYAVIELINQFGSENQKSRYLPLLARGEMFGTIAYLENEEQVLPQDLKTTVVRQGEKLVLEGSKRFVLNSSSSTLFAVLAKADDGQYFWLADKIANGSFKIEAEPSGFGLKTAGAGKATFTKFEIEEKNQLHSGEKDKQFDFALSVVRTLLGAICVGMVEGELAAAANFTKAAQRSGQPLSSSQGIQWKLADQATEGSAARLLVYRAAWSKDGDPAQFVLSASMCKFYASRVARTYSGETIQIMGISHTSEDTNFARLYRDAKMLELIFGGTEEEKAVIGRELKL